MNDCQSICQSVFQSVLIVTFSLKFVDSVFEDNLATFMNKAVNNASKSENSTDNCTHADQKLQKVLPHIRVLNSKWGHLVVEDYQALI